jgi:hypothetical protein
MRRQVLPVVLGLLAILLVFSPACQGKIATNLPEPEYAGPITESLLLALNVSDYAAFSRDFDETLIKALPQANFAPQFESGIRGKIGEYQAGSKRFFQSSSQAQYTTVVYYAVFSAEAGAVLVQISFKMVNGQARVSGLVFNSPQLRG